MLTGFFRQDRPTAFLPLPLLVLVLWPGAGTGDGASPFANPGSTNQMVTGMPFHAPVRWFMELSPWLAVGLSIVVLVGMAYSLNQMANDSELYERRNHLPVVLLPLLLALLPFGLLADPALLGMWAVLWALSRAWTSMGRQHNRSALFDAGLLLGLAGLFYLPYTFLTVVIWATLAVTRPFKFREYLLPLLGMAAMLFLGWGVVHFVAPELWHPVASMHFPAGTPSPVPEHWMYNVILIAVLIVLALSVLISFAAVYGHSVMREKNIRASFLAFAFAMGLLALFAWWLDRRIPPVLLAVPGALLLAYPLLQTKRKAWADAAIWSLLLMACWARWAG
ncbi:MAG: DUF6427 family protein [Flavobacteriales bacterium]|nr:hypothetical protein [Flavobacteriales bacterium]